MVVQIVRGVNSVTSLSVSTVGDQTRTSVTTSSTLPSEVQGGPWSQPLVRVVSVTKYFPDLISAAHFIPNHKGKCKNLHGHNYSVLVTMEGYVSAETGMIADFGDIEDDVMTLIKEQADHKNLNEVYPNILTTAENLAVHWLSGLRGIDSRYSEVTVWETSDSYATASK